MAGILANATILLPFRFANAFGYAGGSDFTQVIPSRMKVAGVLREVGTLPMVRNEDFTILARITVDAVGQLTQVFQV